MGIPAEPFICPSLARGIRRAYLERLDACWSEFGKRYRAHRQRTGGLDLCTPKAFRKETETVRSRLMPGFLPITELTLKAGKKQAWIVFTLSRKEEGQGSAGRAAITGTLFTYPHSIHAKTLPIEFTGHAIDRVIQRIRMIDLPLSPADIEAIHAEFATALLWAGATLHTLTSLPPGEACRLNLVIPAEHGVFLGNFDPDTQGVVFRTFVDNVMLWDEERYALAGLNRFAQEPLALAALDSLANGWMAHDDTQISDQLIDIWTAFGWQIREREERPSKMDAAWAERPQEENHLCA